MHAHAADARFVAALENCTLPVEEFHHRDHLRYAWLVLRELPLEQAIRRIGRAIDRFAVHHGAPDQFDPELTRLYVEEIHRSMQAHSEAIVSAKNGPLSSSHACDFSTFLEANPQLSRPVQAFLEERVERASAQA